MLQGPGFQAWRSVPFEVLFSQCVKTLFPSAIARLVAATFIEISSVLYAGELKSSFIVLERLTADEVIFELPIVNGATVTDINTDAANEPGVNSTPVPVSADATTDAVCVVLTTVVPW